MLRGRRFPAWLVRRSYFRRIARWAKPPRRATPPDLTAIEPEAAPSNVLPFPEPSGEPRGLALTARRGVGTG